VNKIKSIRNYFVDEAGDPNLFSTKGRIIVDTFGCSKYFILGVLDIPSHEDLSEELNQLRKELLSDPYFQDVPSMQPESKKTALAFHAKDDIPEVRKEVFSLLSKRDLKFYAVVRDKSSVINYVKQMNEKKPDYRYHPNELYDYMIRRLFRDKLHKEDSYSICFAKRGKSDRTAALKEALEKARENFYNKWGVFGEAPINVYASSNIESPELQAVDYFLWSLQRLYERHEERYVVYLWRLIHLVHDIDDTRNKIYGVYYTQKNPLRLDKIKRKPEI